MRFGRRETALILLGGVCVLAFLYYLVILSPAVSKQRRLTDYIEKKKTDLDEMIELKARWDGFVASKAKAEKTISRRGAKFTLLSFIGEISREVGIEGRIQYMKPLTFRETTGPLKPAGIEVKVDGINLRQLVDLLYRIEYSQKLLKVTRMKIQRTSEGKNILLNATFQVNTYS